MASNAASSEITAVSATSQSSPDIPMTARQTDQEVDEYWKSVATPESIPIDLKILVREDLKEAWHFNRIDYVHRCVLRLEWAGTDSERLILDDATVKVTRGDLKRLCNRPTSFYWLQSAQCPNNRGERVFLPGTIFAAIFQEWLRYHQFRPDVDSEHFFANPVRITATGPSTVRGIVDAHRSLCLQALDLILQAGGRANHFVSHFPSGVSRYYSLFPLYRALVVIADHIWYEREPDGMISLGRVAQNQTVLIARTGTEADLSAPISFDSIKAQSFPIGVSNAIGPDDDVIRVSLTTAVRFITDLETREKLANPHTMTTTHHDYCLDPPAPKGYEGDRQICSSPDAWADATIAAADRHGYDNNLATWYSIRRVQAHLVGEDFRKLEHWPFQNQYKY
ncbi:MAG: hypothetical protein Q9201_001562 [Fulgogasparrea decipioides]